MNFFDKYEKNTFIKPLDYKWFGKYKKAASFQDYENLISGGGWVRKQKHSFLQGIIENPTLDYPRLRKVNFEEKLKNLFDLKADISRHESNKIIKNVYIQKINEKIIELRMLKAARHSNDTLFFKYSKLLYGIPKKKLFLYTISQIQEMIKDKPGAADSPFSSFLNKNKSRPDRKQIGLIKKTATSTKNPSVLAFIQEKDTFEAGEIKKVFERMLKKMKIYGFNVVIDAEGRYKDISVEQKNNIIIPRNRSVSRRKLVSLINHELGVHVLRKKNGECSKLRLLSLGLDHYLKGEEGLAAYMEQQFTGFTNYAGLNGYLAVSLAVGTDGKKRNFREVFEILKDYYLLLISKKRGKEKMQKAEEFAWARSVRIFRGTTGKTPGACFTKDIVYREGNIGIWSVIKNNPKEKRRFFVGKYDPANPRHTWALDQLGIT